MKREPLFNSNVQKYIMFKILHNFPEKENVNRKMKRFFIQSSERMERILVSEVERFLFIHSFVCFYFSL